MKYCLKCGKIYSESYYDYENGKCINEGFPLIEDPEMTEEKFLQLSEEEKDDYELHILDLCRKSEFFDERKYERETKPYNYYFTFRVDKFEEFTGEKAPTKENELYHDMKAQERLNEAFRRYSQTVGTENTSKCPTCQSARIHKISTSSKVINTALFALFGSKRHKRFHCDNRGYEW